ncbi:MAG: 2-polyprenyl-3-methyl-5-hydroxy-6-metoxy-1,4-benzoquinol methylase [Gammaproteobacteria bacterium]|jgi:2-polyprenyl-3-methyl-5-hydroxy-6-metoxy-1,4-benzoquinol methylase
MTRKPPPHSKVHEALNLDGKVESVKKYYAKWSETYDLDVSSKYIGTVLIGNILTDFINSGESQLAVQKSAIQIADVGCGTGLVAKGLNDQGYTVIDGMDISPEMIVKARRLGIYRQLFDEVDINTPLRDEWREAYDVAICCGVFTLGHVQPEALYQLISLIRPGGLVVTSTRTAYYDATDYQRVSDQVESEGLVELKKCLKDAPYTDDGDAHYWIYEVC